jgi:hypothetical protein
MPKTFDNGSWTSEVANIMASPLKKRVKNEIIDFLEARTTTGATDQEIELGLSRPGNTIRPSRVALAKRGLVVNAGGRWRFTISHRPAKIWVLMKYDEIVKNS